MRLYLPLLTPPFTDYPKFYFTAWFKHLPLHQVCFLSSPNSLAEAHFADLEDEIVSRWSRYSRDNVMHRHRYAR